MNLAKLCSMYYFERGFQVVYAVHHEEEKHVHIHFVINAVSCFDGRKYDKECETRKEELALKYNMFNENLYSVISGCKGYRVPTFTYDTNRGFWEKNWPFYMVVDYSGFGLFDNLHDAQYIKRSLLHGQIVGMDDAESGMVRAYQSFLDLNVDTKYELQIPLLDLDMIPINSFLDVYRLVKNQQARKRIRVEDCLRRW